MANGRGADPQEIELGLIGAVIQWGRPAIDALLGAGWSPEICRYPGHKAIAEWLINRVDNDESIDIASLSHAWDRGDKPAGPCDKMVLFTSSNYMPACLEDLPRIAVEARKGWQQRQVGLLQIRLKEAQMKGDIEEIAKIARELSGVTASPKAKTTKKEVDLESAQRDPAAVAAIRKIPTRARTDARLLADAILRSDPRWAGRIWLDLWRGRLMLGDRLWEDADDATTALWLSKVYGVRIASGAIGELVKAIGRDQGRDPLTDYLGKLVWDGTPRIDYWLQFALGVEDSDLVRAIGRKWLIQAVARANRPGCQADVTLVLVGAQGKFKSSVVAALGGPEFVSDSPLDIGGDTVRVQQQLRAAWIHDLAEGVEVRGTQVDKLKTELTRRKDVYLPKHAKNMVEVPRRCVFVSTANDDRILPDDFSGARRFHPVWCMQGDVPWAQANRDQVWAEAMAAFNHGEQWWLTDAETRQLLDHQQAYVQDDSILKRARKWLRDPDVANRLWVAGERGGREPVTTEDVILGPMAQEKKDLTKRNLEQRAGDVLRRIGFERKKVRTGSTTEWAYVPPKEAQLES